MCDFEKAKQLFIEALDLLQQDDLLGAKQRLLDAHRLVPDRISVITNLTAVLLKLGAPEAKEFALKSVALDESNVEGWLNLITCNEIEGNLTQALNCVDKLITLKPGLIEALERQAVLLRKLGRTDEALLSRTKAQTLVFDDADAYSDHGVALSRLMRFEAAITAFDRAVSLNPDHIAAYVNRGNALKELARYDAAVDSYDKAIALDRGCADAYLNKGNVLQKIKRDDEALTNFDKALTVKPESAVAWSNRSVTLYALERYEEALASCDKAIALRVDYADAYNNRGNVLQELKRHEEALASYDKAIALKADYAEAFYNRGMVLQELERHEEALADCDKAIALKADYAEAHNNRGIALQELERSEEALASYDKAIALKADYAEAFYNCGNALRELERSEAALAHYDKAIALKADYAEAFYNRGMVLQELKRHEEALASYDKAIALKADYADAYNNRGIVLQEFKRYEEALASYDKAIALKADYAEAYLNQGLLRLSVGEFKPGWELYEWRWRTEDLAPRGKELGVSLWIARERIRGADLLLCAEQGIGDEIMFAGMVDEVLREAKSVTLECDSRLHGLYQRSFPRLKVIARQLRPATKGMKFDCIAPVGSPARFYRTSLSGFPKHAGYLKPAPDLTAIWRRKLGALGDSLKVGISWRGGTPKTGIERRSISLDRWRPIFEVKNTQFVGLQYGDLEEETAKWGDQIVFFPDCQNTFDDLGALISALDLVISVQTAVVHLTGALGKPCWVLVSDPAEWRYGQQGAQMPWYPAVRLFRQSMAGDWEAVLHEVAAELRGLSKARRQWP
jgi:tetratricopeptide (TPR) repeat protein